MLTINAQYQLYNISYRAKTYTPKKVPINKPGQTMYNVGMPTHKNPLLNIDNASKSDIGGLLQNKSSSLPETIDTLFYNIGLYLKGEVEQSKFIEYYCKLTEPLYRRISEGKEKELFNESYAPELTMITRIRNAINNSDLNNITADEQLDTIIYDCSKEYLKTPISRKKIFSV